MSRIQKTVARWVGALVLSFCSFSYSNAQETTNNLLTNTWTGTIPYTGTGGGFSGGNTPGYNSSNNTIYFGYTQSTVAQAIAINNALQGSGVQVGGANYGFSYYNQGENSGTLSSILSITSNTGATLHSYSLNHGATTNGWTPFSNSVTFGPYGLNNLGNATLSLTGRDSRFWAGYYGPMVKDPYVNLTYTAATVTNPTFYDDTYVSVPLQFGFPFYGRTFTNSWMHSNGVVSFLDPAVPIPGASYNPGAWAYCCGGEVPTSTRPEFSFIIAPLWTDLYPVASSTFRTEGTPTYQKYFWNNIAEISNQNNLNTFSLEIRPSGFIGATYEKINIQNQQTWIGLVGDPTLNQINQQFFGIPGLNSTLVQNWSVANTPEDLCASNPLSSASCPGYFSAQCTISALYNPSCPGYAAAYYSQQCTLNPLYDVNCPGYASAYLAYQCSVNPLYSTTCEGYQTAQNQCSINPLSNILCSGYSTATQVCSNNPLTYSYCPNYTTALASCSTNPQSNNLCPGYNPISSTPTAGGGGASKTEAVASISSDGTVSTSVSKTGDSNVDKAISSPTTSTSAAAAPAAPVQLAQPSGGPSTTTVAVAAERKQEKQEEKKQDGNAGGSTTQSAQNASTKSDSQGSGTQKTARQEIAERRAEAAKQQAVEKGKEAQKEMETAQNFEAQKAVQNVVIAAMGFTPGFDTYGKAFIPDGRGYQPFTIYNNQRTVDNARVSRGLFGATDRLHNEMTESQYKR